MSTAEFESVSSIMSAALTDVFEEMAFMETWQEGHSVDWHQAGNHWCEIDMPSVHDTTMVITLPEEALSEVADYAWGGVEDPDAARQFLEELLNTIAGLTAGRVFPDASFTLGLPASGTGSYPKTTTLHLDLAFMLEGMPMGVRVYART